MSRITIAQLEAFYWVAELGSVGQAANKLRVTQPTVSLRLRNLEAELSAPVLEAHGRGVRLTPHGQAMFGKAKSVLDAYASFQSDQAEVAVAGSIRIGLAEGFAVVCLPHIVPALAQHYPLLKPEWTVTTSAALEKDILEGSLDLAILVDPVGHRDLRLTPLGWQSNTWAGCGAGAVNPSADAMVPADLSRCTVISTPPPTSMYRSTVAWFAAAGLATPPLCICTSVNAAAQLAGAGVGVGIFPSRMVRAFEAHSTMSRIRTSLAPAVGLVCFAQHAGANPHRIAAVAKLVRDVTTGISYFEA
jgi:DNA-binding transcriptional LysR family regulator